MSKRLMMILSIVERDKGAKLVKELKKMNIQVNFQAVGLGTAPTEMMDIFGLGTNDKDIVLSLAPEADIRALMVNFGTIFESHTKYGGLMIILKLSAAGRILTEILHFDNEKNIEEENVNMKNEHTNNLIIISVNEGYSEDVMNVARKAGATGGTVIKGRLADPSQFEGLAETKAEEDREMLCILAPMKVSRQIMEDVNKSFGLTSPANGIVFSVATEKAYKI